MKRRPGTNLTSENWDQEETEERPGEFQRATREELEGRKISKARRRMNPDQTAPLQTSTIFGGFSGFGGGGGAQQSTNIPSAFSFLTKINTNDKKSSSAADTKSSDDKVDAKNGLDLLKPTATTPTTSTSTFKFGSDSNKPDKNMAEYIANLKTLNKCVLDTISAHLEKTPVCILTPIFEDYETHLKKLKTKFSITDDKNASDTVDTAKMPSGSTEIKSSSVFPKFDLNADKKAAPLPASASFFSFSSTSKPLASGSGSTSTESTKLTSPFAASKDDGEKDKNLNGIFSSNPPKFVFNAQQPFTFGGVQSAPSDKKDETKKDGDDDDEDSPPKVDITPVEEKDSKYSKKCKVFVKKDSGYADKGVAMLHLKPVANSKGTQLLVRANTTLGNILINTLLSSATPVQKMKKNNILIICIPTPDTVPATSTSVLLRVQNEELADELLEELKKCIALADGK